MAYLGSEKLKALIKNLKVIGPDPDFNRISCGAYELSLGDEVFRTDSKDKKKEFLTRDKEQVTINPGQFALLLTQETVDIPIDKIAFISIKAGIKLKGLVNVSGFHVDPGFKGKLVFSVYNAGSGPISLLRGEASFLIWFAEMVLSEKETTSYDKGSHEHKNQDTIPARYIDALLAGELASPNVIVEKLKENYNTLDNKINLNDKGLEGRITAVERDQKANNYIAVTAIGIAIAIVLKFVFDWAVFNTGLNKGVELKQKEAAADSIINQRLVEKRNLISEIDSLEKVKSNLQSSLNTPKK
ncbi:MAG TPA: hypothetical protein VK492_01525 [Chitinophagaceae bacterium]|nr:hypothetical protein [Chitinophagaceae bacterium]